VKDGVAYELGAKHCIDGDPGSNPEQQYLAQLTNDAINNTNQPMQISQLLGVNSQNQLVFGIIYANSINCLVSANCLLPSANPPETGDMMAWAPDPGVVVTDMVMTGQGLLPVVGQKTFPEVAGTRVCHYGFGSQLAYGSAEQCTEVPGYYRLYCLVHPSECRSGNNGIISILGLAGASGDSGGPLYSYAMSNGKAVGVYAIGIVASGDRTGTGFIPMQEVENRLGVTLLT
jgi:hypothetical protein